MFFSRLAFFWINADGWGKTLGFLGYQYIGFSVIWIPINFLDAEKCLVVFNLGGGLFFHRWGKAHGPEGDFSVGFGISIYKAIWVWRTKMAQDKRLGKQFSLYRVFGVAF